ncbi:MAG TPA: hypothetical protein VHE35_00380 [Kofleriaceae bacterium]|nr:hypothetical protein [Kofleriaceae bacterium]
MLAAAPASAASSAASSSGASAASAARADRAARAARPAAAVLVALTLTAAASPAFADGHYFSFGAGPTTIGNELGQVSKGGGRLRLAIGHRFGNVAVEGFVAPEFLDDHEDVSGVGYGVDLRYIVPLTSGVQGYVRGSMSHLTLHDDGAWDTDSREALGGVDERSGRGLGAGVGLQLRGRVRALGFLYWPFFFLPLGPKVDAALYVDHGVDFYRMQDPTGRTDALDARMTRWTFGFNVGKDF